MRYHWSTLKREVARLQSSNEAGNAPIVLNLSDGSTYSVRGKNICRFGYAALFDEGGSEYRAIKNAVEPTNKMIQLLQYVLC